MNAELHLFIIWSNAENKKEAILEDIRSRFTIMGLHQIKWKQEHFSSNLTRFYGENLPPHSNKEKTCGNGPFTLVVVKDESPLYRSRMTSRGSQEVNVNLFDSKEMYRNWTGGGHKIHGTNSEIEARHDLVLLTGYSKEDYEAEYKKSGDVLTTSFTEMPGENGWRNLQEALHVMNEATAYVVLRNFQGLFSDYGKSIHGDVDLLTVNRNAAKLALNAKPVFKNVRRTRYLVKIGDGGTYCDLRYVGDRYLDRTWEERILERRVKTEEGFYRPDEEDYLYSLLYHALIHKKTVAPDYIEVFRQAFPNRDTDDLKKILFEYLTDHGYTMEEPIDYSVLFNESVTGKKMSLQKVLYKGFQKVFK